MQEKAIGEEGVQKANVCVYAKVRAVRCLERHIRTYRERRAQRQAQEDLVRLVDTSVRRIQYKWTRSRILRNLERRYAGAQSIQKRVRGNLSRTMWTGDPGIVFTLRYINPMSNFVYQDCQLEFPKDPKTNSNPRTTMMSYSVPRRRTRYHVGAVIIQSHYRGYRGRLRYNAKWLKMNQIWMWLEGGLSNRHKYLAKLPSANYHHEAKHHMRLPDRKHVRESGFEYEYQDILDLIDDKLGRRLETVPRRNGNGANIQKEEERQNLKNPSSGGETSPSPVLRKAKTTINLLPQKGISEAQARILLGAKVQVQMDDGRFHPGTVMTYHKASNSFDIAFHSVFWTKSGVPRRQALGVSGRRLQTHFVPKHEALDVRSEICEEIERIQRDIVETRENEAGDLIAGFDRMKGPISRNMSVPKSLAEESRLYDAMLAFFRKTEPPDVVADERDLVDFAFEQMYMIEKYWLRMIHDIKHGTKSTCPDAELERPMPERADRIETILATLGLKYDPKNCHIPPSSKNKNPVHGQPLVSNIVKASKDDDPSSRRGSFPFASDSTRSTNIERNSSPVSQDDLTAAHANKKKTPEDIQCLIHEFASLPKEFWKDRVANFSPSRDTRSYVCSFPACGQCFTDIDAAKLHHRREHTGQRRLAVTTPDTDQYLHKYWPRVSPWTDLNKSSSPGNHALTKVGTYVCSVKECGLEFQTREERTDHRASVHRVRPTTDGATNEVGQTFRCIGSSITVQRFSQFLKYIKCDEDFHIKIPFCQLHQGQNPDTCAFCQAQARAPTLPALVYSSVCIRFAGNSEDHHSTMNLHTTTPKSMKSMICPATSNTFYCPLGFCLDAHEVGWMACYEYACPPTYCDNREEQLVSGYDFKYELLLEDRALKFVKLADLDSYAMIHACSKGMFYRKYLRSNDLHRSDEFGKGDWFCRYKLSSHEINLDPFCLRSGKSATSEDSSSHKSSQRARQRRSGISMGESTFEK